jgi:hypothetical protein
MVLKKIVEEKSRKYNPDSHRNYNLIKNFSFGNKEKGRKTAFYSTLNKLQIVDLLPLPDFYLHLFSSCFQILLQAEK